MLNALLWNLLLTSVLAILLGGICCLPWMRRRPAVRHALWLLLLVKMVTPPLVTVPLLPATMHDDEAMFAVAGEAPKQANKQGGKSGAQDKRADVQRFQVQLELIGDQMLVRGEKEAVTKVTELLRQLKQGALKVPQAAAQAKQPGAFLQAYSLGKLDPQADQRQ